MKELNRSNHTNVFPFTEKDTTDTNPSDILNPCNNYFAKVAIDTQSYM